MLEVKIPRIVYDDPQDIYSYFTKENIDSLVDIYSGIEYGMDNEFDDVDMFEVKQSTSNVVMVFNSPKKYWKGNLEWILNKFVDLEEYELASKSKKLIEKLNK